MTPETLVALRGSIAKWRAIVDGTGTDKGPQNCPLCQMFLMEDCVGCPVSDKTGEDGCHGTPYDDYVESDDVEGMAAAAEAELAFLVSLLPDREAP